MTTQILPEKHIRIGESLIGVGAVVLSMLALEPSNLDGIWLTISKTETLRNRVNGTITLDTVILTLDFLYSIGAIVLNEEGLLEHATN